MPVLQLTPKFISTLQCEPGKSRTEWCDTEVKGLYCEARATSPDTGTYYLRYKAGTTRHLRLGSTADISLAQARKLAADKKSEIRRGKDPAMERKLQKQIPTLREFVTEQYLPFKKVRNRSYGTDVQRLNYRILPAFGDKRLDHITTKELINFHSELLEVHNLAPATADHHIKLIRSIMGRAVAWDVIDSNPAAKKVTLFNAYNRVENIMNEDQLCKLLSVLTTHPNRAACRIALFLLSTGCRLQEALCATWSQIDLEQRAWRIPATNSKSKRMRAVPLGKTALEVLAQVESDHPEWVFLNHVTQKNYRTLHNAWQELRTLAGMPWLRLHDLRHCAASMMLASNVNIYSIKEVLGHSCITVTERYLHLTPDRLSGAAETVSDRIRAASPKMLPATLPDHAPEEA